MRSDKFCHHGCHRNACEICVRIGALERNMIDQGKQIDETFKLANDTITRLLEKLIRVEDKLSARNADLRTVIAQRDELRAAKELPVVARPIAELHEDHGHVLLWRIPVVDPPEVGSSLDDNFDEYVAYAGWTHFTPLPPCPIVVDDPKGGAT